MSEINLNSFRIEMQKKITYIIVPKAKAAQNFVSHKFS
jgi:hypothetical protein